jgi:hypothetical protein
MIRANAADSNGDLAAAGAHNDRAEQIFRELGLRTRLEIILNNRAYGEIVAGNFEQAEPRLREIADTAHGQPRLFSIVNHGLALARLGRLDEANVRFAQGLRDATGEARSAEIEFYALEGLAMVAGARGDDLRAARLWGASAAIREATGFVLARPSRPFTTRWYRRFAPGLERPVSTARGTRAGSSRASRRSSSRYARPSA